MSTISSTVPAGTASNLVAVVSGQVQLGKPWYLSKKIWIAALTLIAVVVTQATGKPETTADLVLMVTKVASIVSIGAPLILGIAHVDGKERELALGIVNAAKDLGNPDP